MLQITLPQLRQWQLDQLREWATDLENTVADYAWQLHRTATRFLDLDEFWISESAGAASSWMSKENTSGARLASEVRGFVALVRAGTDRIASERDRLLGTVAETEAEGCPGLGEHPIMFSVDAHWRVHADHTAIRHPTAHVLEQIRIEINSRQAQVSRAYAAFATAVDELTSTLGTSARAVRARTQPIREQSDHVDMNLHVDAVQPPDPQS